MRKVVAASQSASKSTKNYEQGGKVKDDFFLSLDIEYSLLACDTVKEESKADQIRPLTGLLQGCGILLGFSSPVACTGLAGAEFPLYAAKM